MFKNALSKSISVNIAAVIPLSMLLGFKLEDTSKTGGGFPVYLENSLIAPGSYIDIEVDPASYTEGSKFQRTLVFEQGVDAHHLVGPFDVKIGSSQGAGDLAPPGTQLGVSAPFATFRHNDNSHPAATELKAGHRVFIRITKNAHAKPESNSLRFFVQ